MASSASQSSQALSDDGLEDRLQRRSGEDAITLRMLLLPV